MRKFTIAAAAALLAACGGGDSGTVDTEDGTVEYNVDTDGGDAEIRFTDEDGNETVINSGSDVEADLPDGFTVYPGAEVVSNTVMSGADGEGVLMIMTSSDPAEDLVAHYRSEAEAAGVEIQMEMTSGDSKIIGGEGPDSLFMSFNASETDGETTGMLTVGRQP